MNSRQIKALVAEGAKLSLAVASLENKKKRLDVIKETLRQLAQGKEAKFDGLRGTSALVKPFADSLIRTLPAESLPVVRKLVGKHFESLFNAAPAKEFEKTALRLLSTEKSDQLMAIVRTPSSARVSFA